MNVAKLFSKEDKEAIKAAIREAELTTSGEIRVHIEKKCHGDVLDRAAYLFKKLKMHKTKLRNGVLFYIALENKKFGILGDVGINKVVPDNFWVEIKEKMRSYFSEGRITKGLVTGINMAGDALKDHFPYQSDDVNELSNEISFGENQ